MDRVYSKRMGQDVDCYGDARKEGREKIPKGENGSSSIEQSSPMVFVTF